MWRRIVPAPVRRRVRSLLAYPDTWRLVADPASFRRLRRLEDPARRGRPGETLELRFRELEHPVHVRPGTADRYLARDVFFKRHHLPPPELDPGSLRVIWDLGANIGLTMLHMAALHPRARIIGVELDEANANLCAANIAAVGERCTVIHAAVWPADGDVRYRRDEDELSFHVAEESDAPATVDWGTVPALSLDSLLVRSGAGVVDYVKMDIEGAEGMVLRENVEWAAAVRAIKVEVHPPYTVEDGERDLRALGFRTSRLAKRRGGVAGVRN